MYHYEIDEDSIKMLNEIYMNITNGLEVKGKNNTTILFYTTQYLEKILQGGIKQIEEKEEKKEGE